MMIEYPLANLNPAVFTYPGEDGPIDWIKADTAIPRPNLLAAQLNYYTRLLQNDGCQPPLLAPYHGQALNSGSRGEG